jgi:leucyl-tRNA synthetase
MADTSVPKTIEGLAISKTKELKGTEKRDTLIEIEKVGLGPEKMGENGC